MKLKIKYTNWQGETAIRNIQPFTIYHGKTIHHPEEQWLLDSKDLDKDADRQFAVKDMEILEMEDMGSYENDVYIWDYLMLLKNGQNSKI